MPERIRFYTDEHISRTIIKGLRQRGIDILTVPEAGMLGATDEQHLNLAREQGRVILTQDDDFLRLAQAGESHAGIVFLRGAATIGETVRGLLLIHQVMEPGEMEGTIEFL